MNFCEHSVLCNESPYWTDKGRNCYIQGSAGKVHKEMPERWWYLCHWRYLEAIWTRPWAPDSWETLLEQGDGPPELHHILWLCSQTLYIFSLVLFLLLMPLPFAFQHLLGMTAYFSVQHFVANPLPLFNLHFCYQCRPFPDALRSDWSRNWNMCMLSWKLEENRACCLSVYKVSKSCEGFLIPS